MKINSILRFILLAALCACPFSSGTAQTVSPWFRGTPAVWKSILAPSATQLPLSSGSLSKVLSGTVTGYAVKTTAANWISFRISHAGVFSRMEKEIFATHPQNPLGTLGKLAYFYDRDAQLFAKAQQVSTPHQDSFLRHQDLLSKTLAEVEAHFQQTSPQVLANDTFSKEEIARLLQDKIQPAAYMLTNQEIDIFAKLQTLEAQRQWAQFAREQTENKLQTLLNTDPTTLKTYEYNLYYRLKVRLEYFQTLEKVLARAFTPRKSLIMRRRHRLTDTDPLLTDAQVLGKLQFEMDQLQTPELDFTGNTTQGEQFLAAKVRLDQAKELYQPYAMAEALNAPYETALRKGAYAPELLGKEGENLYTLKTPELQNIVAPRLKKLQETKAKLLRTPTATPQFYGQYYHLSAQIQIYQAVLAREKFFRRFNP